MALVPRFTVDQTQAVGSVRHSMLTEIQFQAANGSGWILADGRSIVGSAYAALTGFTNAPDARAVAIRGKDNGRGLNPDGDLPLGTYQGDVFLNHVHFVTTYGNVPAVTNNPASSGAGAGGTATSSGANVGGGNETRMKNVTMNVFIKIN